LTITERLPLPATVTAHNAAYLLTKRDRCGHDLPGLEPPRLALAQ
jgi:3,4-dihydroxy 2-butanone 4-phosphate synthase/GTP cyclohydrolase II